MIVHALMQSYTILLSMQHNNTDPCYIHIYRNIDTGSYHFTVMTSTVIKVVITLAVAITGC